MKQELIKRIYDEFSDMRNQRNKKWRWLNDRTLREYIEDSQLRINGYVPTKEEQGKESWQSNVFHPVTRNKFKAILASVALDIPEIRITAQNERSKEDQKRAYVMRNLLKYTYDNDNKEEKNFFEAWETAEKGTVVVYDGYLRKKEKRRIISSFDPNTGDIETEEKEIETESQCFEQIIPLMNLYIADFHIYDIQKQPALIWVDRMTKEMFDHEYGKYKGAKLVPEKVPETNKNEEDTIYIEMWSDRFEGDSPIEVVKYYNKMNDEFIILANGVLLLDAPLLLGKKKKYYPFAKTVFEPLATDFFYGNSLPNSLMGEQDVINALYNMALDKTYKSMAPALLIGNTNKDDFDLDDQNTTIDTKIYVQDINQVREMPTSGINVSDIKMIEIVSRGIDLSSVDSNQSGVAGRGVTAREVVIANENAKRLKGILYLFLTSLWKQKMRLRIFNILTYYTKDKAKQIIGEGKKGIIDTYMVNNAELPDGTKGTLGIRVSDKLPDKNELDMEAMEYEVRSDKNYHIISMKSEYLDDWTFDINVVSESVFQKDSVLSQMKMQEKLQILASFFPNFIMSNQDKLAKDTLMAYEDDPDEYEFTPPAPANPMGMMTPEMAQGATAGQSQIPPLPAI
jgi:hypothetical protein